MEHKMKIKAILFDLDGTLLPMNQDEFLKAYFAGIAEHLSHYGYNPGELIGAINAGTRAMLKNDGGVTGEVAFWKAFGEKIGKNARKDEPYFEEFYLKKFPSIHTTCGCNPRSRELLDLLHQKGVKTALATNPVFPRIATLERIRWAGLTPNDFEYITTYENSRFCKPRTEYYSEVAEKIGVSPEECLMVGNDVGDDMPAMNLGMRVFLLTDCLINTKNEDISAYPHGDFGALFEFINKLI